MDYEYTSKILEKDLISNNQNRKPCSSRCGYEIFDGCRDSIISYFEKKMLGIIIFRPFSNIIDNSYLQISYLIKSKDYINRKQSVISMWDNASFRDKDKSLQVQGVNTEHESPSFHVAPRNAEMASRFVMQKRRWESSGCSQLRSGGLPVSMFPGNFPVSRAPSGGNFRAARKSVLSARLDSFEKPTIIKGAVCQRHNRNEVRSMLRSFSAPGKRYPRRKLHPWIKGIMIVRFLEEGKARFVAYHTIRHSFSMSSLRTQKYRIYLSPVENKFIFRHDVRKVISCLRILFSILIHIFILLLEL